ncbi:MAG: rhomboid family intramembrane serine protease [Lentisphaeria bacterium]|nr:rhomboid family intramembrane serine protease [Lentisphaeria bacterium]
MSSSPAQILMGEYWVLISSAMVHTAGLHLAFNMYWLYTLGTPMEHAIGKIPFLIFSLTAAVTCSTIHMAFSDHPAIGASGVVYAYFGFMCITRKKYSSFNLLDDRLIKFFIAWLFLCIVLTQFGIMNIANGAHFGGVLFGLAVAGTFVLTKYRVLSTIGLNLLIAFCITVFVWCPWSNSWLWVKATQALKNENYELAFKYYTKFIYKNPQSSEAYNNRSIAQYNLGKKKEAEDDMNMAKELKP